ncbi:MAG: FkbM family methyltransferase [Ignavibacteriales bacterium]|nr:FkbM family methyltransferase [Ignavibacteriales bacterium]
MIEKLFYSVVNFIYKNLPNVYRIIYFYYKNISDRKRIEILKNNIKPGDIVLDIGGNIGFYSSLMAKLVGGKGEVHVFEPDPVNYKHLEHNTRRFKNVKIYKLAAGPSNGLIKLYCSKYLNVDHQTYDSGEMRDTIDVECVSLDTFFDPYKKINFVKIDVQGFDYQVVEGMKNIITNSKDVKILGEFWPFGLAKAGVKSQQYISLLSSLKFNIEFIDKSKATASESFENDINYYTDFWAHK